MVRGSEVTELEPPLVRRPREPNVAVPELLLQPGELAAVHDVERREGTQGLSRKLTERPIPDVGRIFAFSGTTVLPKMGLPR